MLVCIFGAENGPQQSNEMICSMLCSICHRQNILRSAHNLSWIPLNSIFIPFLCLFVVVIESTEAFHVNISFSFNLFQLEGIYKKAHADIRANPLHKKKEHSKPATKKRWNDAKLTLKQRQDKVAKRKEAFIAKLKAEAEA